MQVSGTSGVNFNPAANSGKAPAADGLIDTFNIADTLTQNDKMLTGYDPSSGKINTVANALARYRHTGAISGEVGPDFIDAMKASLVNGGGLPVNPALLMTKGGGASPLSPDTYSALFSILENDAGTEA